VQNSATKGIQGMQAVSKSTNQRLASSGGFEWRENRDELQQ